MKITEIEWVNGYQYDVDGTIFEVCDGELIFVTIPCKLTFDDSDNIATVYSVQKITELDFVKVVDWSNVEVDTKILVRNRGGLWNKRHFYRYEDNTVYTFDMGRTSFTALRQMGKIITNCWDEFKLYEEE